MIKYNDLISRSELLALSEMVRLYDDVDEDIFEDAVLVSDIKSAPAVDAAPAVHGRWKERIRHEHYPSGKEYKQSYCSVCNMSAKEEYEFCPNCGAKMDGEVGDND